MHAQWKCPRILFQKKKKYIKTITWNFKRTCAWVERSIRWLNTIRYSEVYACDK